MQSGFVKTIWKELFFVRFGRQVQRCSTHFAFTAADSVRCCVEGEAEGEMAFVIRLQIVLRCDAFVKFGRVFVERLIFDRCCQVDAAQTALGYFFKERYSVGNRTQKVFVWDVDSFSKD